MKLLFDQNISYRIMKVLPEAFTGSSHVKQEGLINVLDKEIWDFAKNNQYTIVTQDSDFNDLNILKGFPPKIIWIRTGNIKTMALLNILLDYYDELDHFIHDSEFGCFEILKIIKE
jgi:predicted nuclease of predicted toxin-antitoxin system